jgi:hypothetical protein
LPFSEDFVARANRLRELRERRLENIAAVTEPRWGWSLTGIGVVFLAPGVFRLAVAARDGGRPFALEIWLAAAVVTAGAALAATRDWRRSLCGAIALGLVALIGCWGYARGGVTLWTSRPGLALMQALGRWRASILLVANAARPDVGEDTTAASVRSLLGKTSPRCGDVVDLRIVVLLVFSFGIGVEAIALAVAMFFAGVGAVLLQPALTIAIETLRRGAAPSKRGIV